MRRIAHIIHPVVVDESSDLLVAQPITFETMRIAKAFASQKVDVELLCVKYHDERPALPEGFHVTPDLERSVYDIGVFKEKRKLAILRDILDRLYESSDSDYIVYTNVDIALMPHFYLFVDQAIQDGCDAFVINRRTISSEYKCVDELPLMYSDIGEAHPGHDCFVFRKNVYPKYRLGTTCIGLNWVGRVLIWNLLWHGNRFKEFKDEHLTFHIGNDKIWKSQRFSDYIIRNKREALKALSELEAENGPLDIEGPISAYFTDCGIRETRAKRKGGEREPMILTLLCWMKDRLSK